MALQHLRSSTANKRPTPAAMSDGQLALNTNTSSPGLFFKDHTGALIKVGPVHVGTTAPNASPASGGETGNTVGEQWLDTTGGTYVFKVWDGSAWRSETGTFVDVNGDTMTGALGIIAGNATTPGLFVSGDPNTGIYSPGADQLALSTNGTGRLFVDASGNVVAGGTGATSFNSGTGIQVQRDGTACVRVFNNTGGKAGELYADATAVRLDSRGSSGFLAFDIGGSEAMRITNGKLVGIGTSSPGQLLEIASASNPQMRFTDTGDYYYDIGITSSNKFSISPAGSPALTVVAAGNVGIGTTSPSALLHLQQSTGATYFRLTADSATVNGDQTIDIQAIKTGVAYHDLRLDGNSHIYRVQGTERARIDSSGRLLVGTSSAIAPGGITPQIQLEGTSAGDSSVVVKRNSNDAGRPIIYFAKSRGTTKGSNTIVQSGDILGSLLFAGADGSDIVSLGAEISAQVDGTPGTDDMPGRLVFSTTADGASSPTERMRISQAGNINIATAGSEVNVSTGSTDGATFYGATGTVNGIIQASNNTAPVALFRRRTNDGGVIIFYRDTTGVGSISVTTTATAYNTSSDYRLKENVAPVTDGITRLQQLKPSRFNFIADPTKTVDGFLAHEVQTIVPEAITGEKDAVDEDGNPQYQGIDQSKLVPLLTAALQEAVAKIETLEARLTAAGI